MPETISGVLKKNRQKRFILADAANSFKPGPQEIFIKDKLIRAYSLVEGASITASPKKIKGRTEVTEIVSVCGIKPDEFKRRVPYTRLTAIDPQQRFHLAESGETSMRIIDLTAPVGKGTRGLIVAPPKSGKTVLLQQMANAIAAASPETRVIVLLIDERPEEATCFKRSVNAEVFASTSDQSIKEHIELSELVMSNIQVDLECGRDIVVLVDSLTRMGRNFNQNTKPGRYGGRGTLSGGLGVGAMEIPRKFFGLARNIENGGSITIIATCLVNTGSRMDQMIFEEFKGTGNSEIILDRSLAEARIFPAMDLAASGTRKEELLFSESELKGIQAIRKVISGRAPAEAVHLFKKLFQKYETNEQMLRQLASAR